MSRYTLCNKHNISYETDDGCQKCTIDQLTTDNDRLKGEVERQENIICEQVCGDCLEYEDDGTPQTGYGWNENREEGQHACGCIQESGPYQVLEATVQRLTEALRSNCIGIKHLYDAGMIRDGYAVDVMLREIVRANAEALKDQ